MGGFIGAFHPQGLATSFSLTTLRHRCSDAEAAWLSADGRCRLGYTEGEFPEPRLAAPQPSQSHCGRFTLVLIGEIYNHHQVRAGLRFQGWRGNSDSETLVEGLAQRGPALLLDLRGMFAFAAYDIFKQQLLLCRDRLGIKSLLLSWQGGGLWFSSQRRLLPGCEQPSPQTVCQILAFGHDRTPAHVPGPDHQGIVSFPAGMVVRINHSRRHDPVRYWPPQPRPDWTPLPIHDRHRARSFLRQQLEETVSQQMRAGAMPVACLLSSGLHSGILAALASRLQPGGINTVTVVLPRSPAGESSEASLLAAYCGTRHHELVIENHQALAWLEQGMIALDVPTAVGLKAYVISRAVAAEGTKVALCGLGAHELFGGTRSHRLVPWLQLLRWIPARLRSPLLQTLSPRLAGMLLGLPCWDRIHLSLALQRLLNDQDLCAAGAQPLQWPGLPPQRITQGWGQITWAELFGTTEPSLLRDCDAMNMACGLQLRVPFLDHRIVEIALRMPQRFQHPGSALLLQACADLFPPGYMERPRQGISLPMAAWMRGPLRELCQIRLDALKASRWLDQAWIAGQWQAFEAGQISWSRTWRLVVLGELASRELAR